MMPRTIGAFLATACLLAACATPSNQANFPNAEPASDRRGPAALTRGVGGLNAPDYQIGEEWRYNDGYGMRVVEVMGDRAKFQRLDAPEQWHINRGLFREQAKSSTALRTVTFRSDDPTRLYSLPYNQALVFVREYTRNEDVLRHRTSWIIEGQETVTVPAGTFRTFVIVKRTRSLASDWNGFERMWWSPVLKNYVRMEYRYGEMPVQTRSLVSTSLLSRTS